MNSHFRVAVIGSVFALATVLMPARASAAVIMDLDCILASSTCTPSASFGTITIDDIVGGVSVTVDLAGTGEKFRDLRLNLASAFALTDNDPANAIFYSADFFDEDPYNGLFDVGAVSAKNWNGNDGYTVNLLAGGLTAALFNTTDTLGLVTAALHIQNIDCPTSGCIPGSNGGGSLKIGATVRDVRDLPEPVSLILFGMAAAGSAWRMRRQRRA
jgi:hypothetical protein